MTFTFINFNVQHKCITRRARSSISAYSKHETYKSCPVEATIKWRTKRTVSMLTSTFSVYEHMSIPSIIPIGSILLTHFGKDISTPFCAQHSRAMSTWRSCLWLSPGSVLLVLQLGTIYNDSSLSVCFLCLWGVTIAYRMLLAITFMIYTYFGE